MLLSTIFHFPSNSSHPSSHFPCPSTILCTIFPSFPRISLFMRKRKSSLARTSLKSKPIFIAHYRISDKVTSLKIVDILILLPKTFFKVAKIISASTNVCGEYKLAVSLFPFVAIFFSLQITSLCCTFLPYFSRLFFTPHGFLAFEKGWPRKNSFANIVIVSFQYLGHELARNANKIIIISYLHLSKNTFAWT